MTWLFTMKNLGYLLHKHSLTHKTSMPALIKFNIKFWDSKFNNQTR